LGNRKILEDLSRSNRKEAEKSNNFNPVESSQRQIRKLHKKPELWHDDITSLHCTMPILTNLEGTYYGLLYSCIV